MLFDRCFTRPNLVAALLACSLACTTATANDRPANRDFTPSSDATVLETLPARVNVPKPAPLLVAPAASSQGLPALQTSPQATQAAAKAAQEWIELARSTADPRYLGRAEATLAPWWDKPDAPPQLLVLQATVQQSRHAFEPARRTLQIALKREPSLAQGWLTLATLERLAGNYPAALAACDQVARAAAPLYASACSLETRSLQGQFDEARDGFKALITAHQQPHNTTVRAWLASLLAESEERAGRSAAAAKAYQASLGLAQDGYTALAYADLLLRNAATAALAKRALEVLKAEPSSDAVLLRRAYANQLLGNKEQAAALASELAERFAALQARGDDMALHAREGALAALWLDVNPAKAWPLAEANLSLQKEPLDWYLALQSADAAGKAAELQRLKTQLAASGLKDARLVRWQGGLTSAGAP